MGCGDNKAKTGTVRVAWGGHCFSTPRTGIVIGEAYRLSDRRPELVIQPYKPEEGERERVLGYDDVRFFELVDEEPVLSLGWRLDVVEYHRREFEEEYAFVAANNRDEQELRSI